MPGKQSASGDDVCRTRTGKVLTDADVESLATEAEGDFDVDALKARGRGSERPAPVCGDTQRDS